MNKIKDVDLEPLFLDTNIEDNIKFSLLPAIYEDKHIFVTKESELIEALNFYNKQNNEFELYIVDDNSFSRILNKFLEKKTASDLQNSHIEDQEINQDINLDDFIKDGLDILNSENSAPIIKFVNSMFYQAINKKASDIHIETHEKYGLIRFRIDGVLINQATIDKNIINLIINRIKVISNLDISEKRIAQDGRTQIKINNQTTDMRVSLLPTYFGEKVVIRILMESSEIPTLEELGFNNEIKQGFEELLTHSYGMILVTGPTGSGKSTTLHAFLQIISSPEKNIITVENPVEYKADNINQIQVNDKVGLTFATGLRSILRQDPDVIMVGEIRDKETARTAIQAALTGHLMLSTLHTNNAVATISRLIDIGVEPFLLSSSLIGILSQRLVRILCDCKTIDEENSKKFNKTIYKENGCAKCNFTGFLGRKAVGELFIIDDEVRYLIAKRATDVELKKYMANKSKTIKDNIIELLNTGQTSLKEAIRVGLKD